MKKTLLFLCLIGSATITHAQDEGEDVKVEGQLLIPNIDNTENVETGIMVIGEGGQAKLLSFPNFLVGAYGSDCVIYDLGGGTTSLTPTWQSTSVTGSSTGYLFTGSQCPANVGIGTDTPRSRLDVIGTTYSSKLALGVDPQNMVGNFHMKYPASSNISGTVFQIENADKKILYLDNSGLLRTREVMVDADVWPDYVFEDDYTLMPLKRVEQYIKKNGHLPNVPSEEAVQEDGQCLGEMNIILLEKVEELTLYLIEQQKQLETQQEQVLLLQEQIQSEK